MKTYSIVETVKYLYLILFTYTGLTKLIGYERSVAVISGPPIISDHAALIAWVVPVLELLTVCFLIVPRLLKTGLYISLTLMTIFTTYIATILTSGKKLPCSCGGVLEIMSWQQHLVFNIAFTLLAVVAIILKQSPGKEKLKYTDQSLSAP